ncbi:MAG: hypothetical protein ACI9TV_000450 [Sulfurimonas sp.]|jgi:uncharacterized protein (DUF2249 family)|uniref:hypothetical protein n=1 Tax=Sulfurimonas sp. TaxID=2022749 RepID=UPI0039E3CA27
MNLIPENAQEVEVNGATVPFYKYDKDGKVVYQFDSSSCGHPEPMINAMSGLQMLSGNELLIMINAKAPMGLFPKIEADFNFKVEDMEGGKFKITFTKKTKNDEATDFDDTGCAGGGGCTN